MMLSTRAYTPQGHLILAADPAIEDSTPGDVYYNSTLNALRVFVNADAYGDGAFDAGEPYATPDTAQWQSLAPLELVTNRVVGYNGVTGLWSGTQAEYDAVNPHSDTILYVIT